MTNKKEIGGHEPSDQQLSAAEIEALAQALSGVEHEEFTIDDLEHSLEHLDSTLAKFENNVVHFND